MNEISETPTLPRLFRASSRLWVVNVSSLLFILLQSACTAVIAFSGISAVIGLGSLAAALGLDRLAGSFHADIIRIPMMTIALSGSLIISTCSGEFGVCVRGRHRNGAFVLCLRNREGASYSSFASPCSQSPWSWPSGLRTRFYITLTSPKALPEKRAYVTMERSRDQVDFFPVSITGFSNRSWGILSGHCNQSDDQDSNSLKTNHSCAG